MSQGHVLQAITCGQYRRLSRLLQDHPHLIHASIADEAAPLIIAARYGACRSSPQRDRPGVESRSERRFACVAASVSQHIGMTTCVCAPPCAGAVGWTWSRCCWTWELTAAARTPRLGGGVEYHRVGHRARAGARVLTGSHGTV